jgi:hypothetical protein
MKKLIILALLCPLFTTAQDEENHRFENDTLYTSSGYKIYPGRTLQIGKRANDFTGFRYISKISTQPTSLENIAVLVKELSGYGHSPTGSATIDVKASINYRDGSKGLVSFTLAFDLAIGSRLPGTYHELTLPEEYRISVAQAMALHKPALQSDTLYTSSGYKIYLGRLLQFGDATGKNGWYRYITFLTPTKPSSVEGKQFRVEEIKDLTFSVLGNAYINIIGTLMVNNTEGRELQLHIAFDHAIEDVRGITGELVVPDEFKGVLKKDVHTEFKRVENLYLDGIISKEAFEAAKKYLLVQ